MGIEWFEHLFSFAEKDYRWTQSMFTLEKDEFGDVVVGPNKKRFSVGSFSTPSVGELWARLRSLPASPEGASKTTTLHHTAVRDIFLSHSEPANRGAMIQVASQFNCLEFTGPGVVPERGVSIYAHDPTQGPACSLACGASTLFRNYFVPRAEGRLGQTRDDQINNVDALAAALAEVSGDPRPFFTIKNGYTQSSKDDLVRLRAVLNPANREGLIATVKIGIHSQAAVSFKDRDWNPPDAPIRVSQAFCSAVSCAYTSIDNRLWEPLASLVLDAAYEATLVAAAIEKAEGKGSGKVLLTMLGGGVFGNDAKWIAHAIARAVLKCKDLGLEVHVCHYMSVDDDMVEEISHAFDKIQALARTTTK